MKKKDKIRKIKRDKYNQMVKKCLENVINQYHNYQNGQYYNY